MVSRRSQLRTTGTIASHFGHRVLYGHPYVCSMRPVYRDDQVESASTFVLDKIPRRIFCYLNLRKLGSDWHWTICWASILYRVLGSSVYLQSRSIHRYRLHVYRLLPRTKFFFVRMWRAPVSQSRTKTLWNPESQSLHVAVLSSWWNLTWVRELWVSMARLWVESDEACDVVEVLLYIALTQLRSIVCE